MIRVIIFFLLLQCPAMAQKIVQFRDELHHPDLAWPVSLLSYKAKGVKAVVDVQTGKFVPFQQSGETLYLLSDLPSGAQRRFRFQTGPGENPLPVHAVRVKRINRDPSSSAMVLSRYKFLPVVKPGRPFCNSATWAGDNCLLP